MGRARLVFPRRPLHGYWVKTLQSQILLDLVFGDLGGDVTYHRLDRLFLFKLVRVVRYRSVVGYTVRFLRVWRAHALWRVAPSRRVRCSGWSPKGELLEAVYLLISSLARKQ